MNIQHSKPLQVLMMPDYRHDNLYQSLLADALESEKAKVVFPQGYRRVLPFFRAVKDNRCDVLHIHWLTPYIRSDKWFGSFFYSCKFLVDIFLVRCLGVKVVWTVHNQSAHNCCFPNLDLWLRKSIAKLVDKLIVHNNSTVDFLEQSWKIDRLKIAVIPHGHYRDAYYPAIDKAEARKQLNLPLNGRIYLNLGMLRPYKGIENFLDVWRDNQHLFERDTLLIAGKPLDEEYGLKLSKLAESIPNVMLHSDFIESDRIHLFYSAADVVILPFTNILTSGSLILAMSYGKPVTAPKQGEISETLGQANDLLYDPNETDALLHALEKSTHVDLDRLSQQVVESCDRLNWDKIALKTQQVYISKDELVSTQKTSLKMSN